MVLGAKQNQQLTFHNWSKNDATKTDLARHASTSALELTGTHLDDVPRRSVGIAVDLHCLAGVFDGHVTLIDEVVD